MSIEIIDILKPKNGLSFKLIEDVDIAVQGYESLADAVSHFVTQSAVQQIINAALSGKQDTLTETQLAACNSGITAQLVTQIGTNTAAIAGKASQSDLDALSTTVAAKADASDVATADASLQAQIDAIVTPVTQDAEVQNARVDATGVTHASLKARIDSADTRLTTDFNNVYNSLISEKIYVKLDLTKPSTVRFNSVALSLDTFPLTVLCNSLDYSFYIEYFDSNDVSLQNTSWAKTEVTYSTYPTNTAYAKIVCKADDGHVLDLSETAHFSAYSVFKCYELIDGINSDISDIETDVSDIVDMSGVKWTSGYINKDAVIQNGDAGREYSSPIPCNGSTTVSFKGETNHANISALTCYGVNDTVLQTNVNIGDIATAHTVTTPAGTVYVRISKKTDQEFYLQSTNPVIIDKINKNTSDLIGAMAEIAESLDLAKTLVKVTNYGTQTRDLQSSFTNGFVHERNYNNAASSANTAYSDLKKTIGQVTVKPKTGYKALVAYIDSNYDCTSWSAFTTDDFTLVPPTPYYCLELRKSDDSTFDVADLPSDVVELTDYIGTQIPNGECYVQALGSDNNDGLTRATPFATIQKAIDSGYKTILVKEGIYNDGFTMDGLEGVKIMLDHYYDTFTAGSDEGNPKVVIDGNINSLTDGCDIRNCINCTIQNIEVRNVSGKAFIVSKCTGMKFTDCVAHNIGVGAASNSVGGFMITYTDADFDNCVAYNIGTNTAGSGTYHNDGFNIHGTGTTNFINCSAWNCEDDGISHHDACCGKIEGGEFYNCGKGGIASPTHGAKINVSNIYSHNNAIGMYIDSDGSVLSDRGNIILSNCVCSNNSEKDMYVGDYYKVIAINCVYTTITGTDNVTRFGIT